MVAARLRNDSKYIVTKPTAFKIYISETSTEAPLGK